MKKTLSQLVCAGATAAALTSIASAQIVLDPAVNYSVGPEPDATAIGDFNSDGHMDIATAFSGGANDGLTIRLNQGDGTFGPASTVFLGSGVSPHTPVAGDLDGNGTIDIAVSLKNVNRVQIISNAGGAAFVPGPTFNVGAEPRDMKIGNLDADTDLDLAVSNRDGNTVSVLLNQGGMSFTVASYAAGQEPRELDLGDFNGDSLLDIAVASHDSREVIVLRNTGGTFVNFANLFVGGQLRPEGVAAADFNGDSFVDIAASTNINTGTEFATVFLNQAGAGFGGPVSYPLIGADASSLVASDLDLDGDPDLASANTDSNNICVLTNLGGGTFGSAQTLGAGGEPGHITAGALNAGKGEDLVVTNETTNSVSVFINNATGIETYCTPKVNSCGTLPAISFQGAPSASASTGFVVSGSNAKANRSGLLLYTDAGRAAVPFQGGTLCVANPSRAVPVQSGGNGTDCNGTFAIDMNAFAAGSLGGNPQGFLGTPGTQVNGQWWGRDTAAQGSYLSDGLEWIVCP